MKLIVDNVVTQAVVGGKDNLLKVKVWKELREYLRVRPSGYNWSPAYRRGQWDGWRYLITETGNFATGFVPLVYDFVTDLGVPCEVIDNRGDIPVLIDKINPVVGGITMADHQLKSVESVKKWIKVGENGMYFPRGILDGATNAGKTMIIAAVHNSIKGEARGIYLTHSILIYEQAMEYFTGLYGRIGEVCSSKYDIDPHFTIAMAKTLLNRSKKVNVVRELAKFNVLYLDETHKAGSDDYSALIKKIPAPMRLFVSGTPLDNDDKTTNMIIVGLSGPVLSTITNKELIDKGWSLKPIVKIVLNDSQVNYGRRRPGYDDELHHVVQYPF